MITTYVGSHLNNGMRRYCNRSLYEKCAFGAPHSRFVAMWMSLQFPAGNKDRAAPCIPKM